MIGVLIILQIILVVLMIYFILVNTKNTRGRKIVIDKENKKEMDRLQKMRQISLTIPLTEKSRPKKFNEIIGQEKGIMALKAAICGSNPQHVLIYGPPGVGKTAAARLVLEEAKKMNNSPFKRDAKFIEIDATTLRFDERGIADPLIGSVHDPIYQGAGALGIAGIPQPKAGAVTKAHGGILFIDEIGELHPIELNKLLKVLEDRAVFLDSSYYSSEDPNMPNYIKEIFDNGLPADFRLIGATTRSPEEILPAIRSRCVEIFFRNLTADEIRVIAKNSLEKINLQINDDAAKLVGEYCTNGREVVNLIQLAAGLALNENRNILMEEDIEWVLENGQYSKRFEPCVSKVPQVGVANGLAVYGSNIGIIMQIESTAKLVTGRKGKLKVTGIIEEEEITNSNRKIKRKSNAYSSVENVLTVLDTLYDLQIENYDIHVNIPGGVPVDGPSAGITIASAIYSAINNIKIDNLVAMTGEINLLGGVKAIGGVEEKINGAKKAGAKRVIIPQENWIERFNDITDIEIIGVDSFKEVLELALIKDKTLEKTEIDILSAESKEV